MFFDMLSTFINVLGDFKTSSAQQKAYTYNANLAKFNQGVTQQEGAVAVDAQRKQNAQRLGLMRANIGASGLDLEGSGLDMLYSNAYQGEIDARTTQWNYDQKAKGYGMEADLATSQSNDAQSSGYINAASSVLRGATGLYKNSPNPDDAGTSPFSLG